MCVLLCFYIWWSSLITATSTSRLFHSAFITSVITSVITIYSIVQLFYYVFENSLLLIIANLHLGKNGFLHIEGPNVLFISLLQRWTLPMLGIYGNIQPSWFIENRSALVWKAWKQKSYPEIYRAFYRPCCFLCGWMADIFYINITKFTWPGLAKHFFLNLTYKENVFVFSSLWVITWC